MRALGIDHPEHIQRQGPPSEARELTVDESPNAAACDTSEKCAVQSPYLTPAEAASYLRLGDAQTLSNWRSQGKGPDYLKFGARVLYLQSDLDRWAAAQRHVVTQ